MTLERAVPVSGSAAAPRADMVVLLQGPGGADPDDLVFLHAMLSRRGRVQSLHVPASSEDLSDVRGWAAASRRPGGHVTLVAVGGHAEQAVREAARSRSPRPRLVLIDPPTADVEASTHLEDVLVIASGPQLGDVRRVLRERPARILSLIEAFLDEPVDADEPGGPRPDPARTAAPGIQNPGVENPRIENPGTQNAGTQDPGTRAPATEVDTVIVGAGFAGLGAGIRLARRGEQSFVILERANDVGGTWRDNVYPGVACDIPSHLYSFSFLPKPDWSSFFAGGAEIHDYLRDAARSEGLHAHLRLGTEVLEMRWSADDLRWSVRTSTGDVVCRTLIVAAGRLSDARMPDVPGLDTFAGPIMHSSVWDDTVSLEGKRVGVVGTGASAAQLIPHLAKTAASVVVFQRSAPYVVPRPDREYSVDERLDFELDPASHAAMRDDLFWAAETAFAERMRVPGFIDRLRDRALRHLESQVPDAAVRAAATPDYEIGCKRVVISNDYYPALASPTVTLEPSTLASVSARVASSAMGAEHEVDVLVFATGFESTRPPFAARTFGVGGTRLADVWSEGMRAHASTAVHGFPNLFVLDGPNASLGHNSAVVMIEAQLDYVLGALDHRLAEGVDVLDVSLAAQNAYVDEIDSKAASSVWLTGGCDSWYVDERSGRLTLLWPDFAYAFQRRLARFDAENYVAVEAATAF